MSGILKDAFWRDRERRQSDLGELDRLRCEVKRLRDVNWDLLAACEAAKAESWKQFTWHYDRNERLQAMVCRSMAERLDSTIAKARAGEEGG